VASDCPRGQSALLAVYFCTAGDLLEKKEVNSISELFYFTCNCWRCPYGSAVVICPIYSDTFEALILYSCVKFQMIFSLVFMRNNYQKQTIRFNTYFFKAHCHGLVIFVFHNFSLLDSL
jgi:hypothetical protein